MNRLLVGVSILLLGASCSLASRTQDGGVFRSETAGTDWVQKVFVRQERKSAVLLDGANARAFRFDRNGSLYLVTRENGVWRTDDRAEHWVQLGLNANPVDFAIDPEAVSVLYAAVGGQVQRSGDSGATWTVVYTAPRPGEAITGVVVDPKNPAHVLTVTSAGSTVDSHDSGATWTVRSFQNTALVQFTVHPQTAQVLYAVTPGGPIKSVDGGATWTNLSEQLKGFSGGAAVNQLLLTPDDPQRIYLASNYGILVSYDSGATWAAVPTLVPPGTPVSLIAARDARTLLFVTSNRLQRTTDGGRTWSTPRVPTNRALVALTFDPKSADTAYVGTLRVKR